MHIEYEKYREEHPHRKRRIVWSVINRFVFPLLSRRCRLGVLRWFGAKIGSGDVRRSVKIFAPWNLEMGVWACLGPRVKVYNKDKVKIGSHIVISQDVYLCTAGHDVSSPWMAPITKPIEICDNSWIAARAVILPGVTVGEGAVVGCAAVVAKDVKPWTVVGGNPAQFLKNRVINQAS